MDKPHIGCYSQKLNHDVNSMVTDTFELSPTISFVHEIMLSAHGLYNAALLQNLTDLKPIIHNATRWTCKLRMLNGFINIREELISLDSSADGYVAIDTSPRLLPCVVRYRKILGKVYVITRSLQTKCQILASCRDGFNVLIDYVHNQMNIL